jgi:hypothetical protein
MPSLSPRIPATPWTALPDARDAIVGSNDPSVYLISGFPAARDLINRSRNSRQSPWALVR